MSQEIPIDEIEQHLVTLRAKAPPDTELIDIYNQIAEHRYVDVQRKLVVSQEAYDLAQSLNDIPRLVRSLVNICLSYSAQAQVEMVLPRANEVLTLLESSPDPHLEAHIYFCFAQSNRLMGQYSHLFSYGSQALRLYQQVGDRDNEAETLNEMSIGYVFLGQMDQALTFFHKALHIYRATNNTAKQANMLNNIAFTYLQQGMLEQARTTIEESLQILRTPYSLDTMCEILLNLGEIDIAERYAQEAHALNHSEDGSVRFQDAEVAILHNLARIYQRQRMFDQTKKHYEAALACSITNNLKQSQTEVLQDLVTFYEEQDDIEQALSYFKHFHNLEKELFNEESNQKIRNLQVMHETETARREASIFQQENLKLEQTITALEQTKSELQTALTEVEQRAEEQMQLLAENERQRQTISELNLPVLPLTETIMIMPLIGKLDTNRLQQLQERALSAIHRTATTHVLLDITGVSIVDTQVAQGIIAVVQATRLLGAEVILVGIRPEVAQAIVSLGLDLRGVQTTANLQAALKSLGLLKTARSSQFRSMKV